jgi:hypothetical protein
MITSPSRNSPCTFYRNRKGRVRWVVAYHTSHDEFAPERANTMPRLDLSVYPQITIMTRKYVATTGI